MNFFKWLIVPLVLFTLTHFYFNQHKYLAACDPVGDRAVISIQTELAQDFKIYSGAYSRIKINHPSPITVYIYAAFTKVFSFLEPQGAIHLAQLSLNLLVLFLVLLIFYQTSAKYSLAVIFLISCLVLQVIGQRFWFEVWNPAAVILPMMLFLVAVAAAITQHGKYLILAAIGGVLASAGHTSCLAIIVLLSPFIVFFYAKARKFKLSKPDYASLAAAILIALFAYSLPIYDLIINWQESNLYRLFAYAIQPKATNHSLVDGYLFVANFYTRPFASVVAINSSYFLPVLIILLILLPFKSNFFKCLRNQVVIIIFLSIFLAKKVDNYQLEYIFWWQYSVVILSYFLLIASVLSVLINQSALINKFAYAALIIISLSTALLFQSHQRICSNGFQQILAYLEEDKSESYQIEITSLKTWKYTAGLALRLLRRDIPFCMRGWGFMFTENLVCTDKTSGRKLTILETKNIQNPNQPNLFRHRGNSVLVE